MHFAVRRVLLFNDVETIGSKAAYARAAFSISARYRHMVDPAGTDFGSKSASRRDGWVVVSAKVGLIDDVDFH
jgi:hypothetical protein